MLFHDGKLPFHSLCVAKAPCSFLEWWLEQSPDDISTPTTDTGNFPLHCYLSSSNTMIATTSTTEVELSMEMQPNSSDMSAAVIYLAKRYPAAMRTTNRRGWLPLHVAAMYDAPLDVLFYLVREFPESVMRPVDYHEPVFEAKRPRI